MLGASLRLECFPRSPNESPSTLQNVKTGLLAVLLFAARSAIAADSVNSVTVRVDWLNYEQLHCKGCRTQIITMQADTFCIFSHDCDLGRTYTKVAARCIGSLIQVSVSGEKRRDDGTFEDMQSGSVVLTHNDPKNLQVGEIKFRLAAARTTQNAPSVPPEDGAAPNRTKAQQTPSPVLNS